MSCIVGGATHHPRALLTMRLTIRSSGCCEHLIPERTVHGWDCSPPAAKDRCLWWGCAIGGDGRYAVNGRYTVNDAGNGHRGVPLLLLINSTARDRRG